MKRTLFKIRLGLALAFAVAAPVSSAQAKPMIEAGSGASAQASFSTPQGLKADGLRLQGIAHVYQSIGLSTTTGSALVGRPPDVSDAAQAARTVSLSQSSGFDWGDYTVGIGTGMGLILILAGGLAMGRQRRHHVQTA
jgi:hypothetical protein